MTSTFPRFFFHISRRAQRADENFAKSCDFGRKKCAKGGHGKRTWTEKEGYAANQNTRLGNPTYVEVEHNETTFRSSEIYNFLLLQNRLETTRGDVDC